MKTEVGKVAALGVSWTGLFSLGYLAHLSGHLSGEGIGWLAVAGFVIAMGVLKI